MSTAAALAEETAEEAKMRPGTMNQVVGAQDHGLRRRAPNENEPHYIWIALASVYHGHRNNGSSFIGDFSGEILPAKTPLRIDPTRAYAPYEIKAIAIELASEGEKNSLPEVDRHPNSMVSENTAASLVEFIRKNYEDFGVAFFPELVGEDSVNVNAAFSTIFSESYFKELADKEGGNVRTTEGVDFQGPFLDQIRDYLKQNRGKILARPGVTREAREMLSKIIGELDKSIEKAWGAANAKLNNTEEQIRDAANGKPGGKPWYDMPDHRFPNSLPPQDLVCLVQTNRVPIDLKQLDASREMSEKMGASVVEGMKQAMAGNNTNGGVSMDDVKKLLAEQASEYEAKISAALKPGAADPAPKEKGKE